MNSKHSFIYTFLLYTLLLAACSGLHQKATVLKLNIDAYKKFNSGDYRGTITLCRKALENNPKDDISLGLMGDSYSRLELYDSALIKYDSAISINPRDGYYRFNRGIVDCNLSHYKEAVADNTFAIKKNVLKACAYNNRAIVNDKTKDYTNALKDYDSCISAGQNLHRFVLVNKAFVYTKENKYDSALAEINKCIKLDSLQISYPLHLTHKTKAKLIEEKTSQFADTVFIKQLKEATDAYDFKGYLLSVFGKNKEAWACLNKEKTLGVNSYANYLFKATICINTMQYDEAERYNNMAIETSPKQNSSYTQKGILNTIIGKYKEALMDFDTAILISNTEADPFVGKGNLYILMENNDSAIANFNYALKVNDISSNVEAYNARGYAYFLKKQYKEALADYDSAIKVSKTYYQPYYNYKEEAMRALQKNTTVFCTLVEWQAPINDINGLVDNAKFHIADGDILAANFKITTNRPFEKDKLFVMVDGQSVAIENKATLSVLKEDSSINKYEYGYGIKLNLIKGQHLLYLDYDGKSSQKMRVVVE